MTVLRSNVTSYLDYTNTQPQQEKTDTKMAKAQSAELVKSNQSSDLSIPLSGLAQAGFIEEVVVKVGDPEKEGVIEYHVGELIGPGSDIELSTSDKEGVHDTMPTWQLHPIVKDAVGKLVVDKSSIHNVIASSQLDSAYKRAMATKLTTGKNIWVGAQFIEQTENRKGQPLNKFRISYKLVD